MLKVKILRMLAVVSLAMAVIMNNLWCAMAAVVLFCVSVGMRIVSRRNEEK